MASSVGLSAPTEMPVAASPGRKRRLLHVCGNVRGGGIRSFVVSVAGLNAGSDTVHDVLLIYDDKGDVDGAAVGCTVHRLGYPGVGMGAAMRRFAALARAYDAVLIHAAHPVVVAPLLWRRMPCLLFQHGMAVSHGARPVRLLKRWWFAGIPVLLGARVVCSTAYAFDKMRALGIRISPDRVDVIPFGIPLERHAPPPPVEGEIRIGMAGNLVSQKRMHLVLEGLRGWRGSQRLHLWVAGAGPERDRLEALAEAVRSDRVAVTFAGQVQDMKAFYDTLDLFVFPSRGESFGLVTVEALSRGVPVAVFEDVGGCRPLIEDDVNGFVMAPGVDGVRDLLNRLAREPGQLERCKRAVARMDLSDYDIARTRHELDERAARLEG